MNKKSLSDNQIYNKDKINFSNFTIYIIVIILILILSFSRKEFLSYRNFYSLFFGLSVQFYAIIGCTFLIIMGELDLSIGSIFAFTGMFTGGILNLQLGLPLWLSIVIGICVTAIIGLISGYIITKFNIPSLMVTLGMLTLFRGISNGMVTHFRGASYKSEFSTIASFKIFNIHFSIYLMVFILIIIEILLKKKYYF